MHGRTNYPFSSTQIMIWFILARQEEVHKVQFRLMRTQQGGGHLELILLEYLFVFMLFWASMRAVPGELDCDERSRTERGLNSLWSSIHSLSATSMALHHLASKGFYSETALPRKIDSTHNRPIIHKNRGRVGILQFLGGHRALTEFRLNVSLGLWAARRPIQWTG